MSTPRDSASGSFAVAPKTNGNPEGKGLNGLILDWHQSMPRRVVAKPQQQVLAELFTSMLVLSATFKYRPVVGAENYLYWIDDNWHLSLIAPDEWSDERRAAFAGAFVLQRDMTWTIAPSDQLTEDNAVSDAIGQFCDAFAEKLDTDLALEAILPFYVKQFSYYPRLYASALSRSVSAAMTLGGHSLTSCRKFYALLPTVKNRLLAYGN